MEKKYIRNTKSNIFTAGKIIFRPRGEYGDAVEYSEAIMQDPNILRALDNGDLELTNRRAKKPVEKENPAVKVTKNRDKVVVLSTCLGVKRDGAFCNTQVTYIGDEKPPLCPAHKDQIDKIEYHPDFGWRRKE